MLACSRACSFWNLPGVPGATNLAAGFLERIPCAMELPRRGGEEKRSSVTDETAPKAAVCPCFDIVTGLILCGVPQFTRVMPVSGGVVVSFEKLNAYVL